MKFIHDNVSANLEVPFIRKAQEDLATKKWMKTFIIINAITITAVIIGVLFLI